MSGDNLVCNIAKGRLATYADTPGDEALGLLILQSSGLGDDDDLRDAQTVEDLLEEATECSADGYSRATLDNVSVTVDYTNDRVDITCDDVSLGPVGTGGSPQPQAKAVIFWDPDSTDSTPDGDLIPLAAYSYDVVFDGSNVSINMPSGGPLYAE